MFTNKLTFSRKYFSLTVSLFLIEVCIAVFIDDQFIRPFIGDVLAVILLYYFVKCFWKIRSNVAALSIFIFACAIEGQWFRVMSNKKHCNICRIELVVKDKLWLKISV